MLLLWEESNEVAEEEIGIEVLGNDKIKDKIAKYGAEVVVDKTGGEVLKLHEGNTHYRYKTDYDAETVRNNTS